MGVFKKVEDNLVGSQKESIFDEIDKQFRAKPREIGRASLCALFVGRPSTGKSGTALDYVRFLKDDERLVVVDLDAGCEENISEYYDVESDAGKIQYFNPAKWTKGEVGKKRVTLDYDATMEMIRAIGVYVGEHHEEFKIRAIILDGVSKLKQWAEYQMKLDKHMDISGDPKRKYWRIRNVDFLEILELYKSIIDVDTIFIGNDEFALEENEVKALFRDTNDLVSQKVIFEKEETDSKIQFYARIDKSRQNFRNVGKRIEFAQLDKVDEEKDYEWDSSNLIRLLQSDRKPILDEIEKK
ncbi:MAG: hypothetical protein Q8M92_01865 [Candidatus Subteraquimicrobiales bacterium]|nr:hypothetical protein [Candidatus Subteraquimicrobiales bacterium]